MRHQINERLREHQDDQVRAYNRRQLISSVVYMVALVVGPLVAIALANVILTASDAGFQVPYTLKTYLATFVLLACARMG